MKVPFTWKVTGWFMIGWSAEFPAADVRPLLEWNIVDQEWRFLTGWPDASSDDPDKWRCGSTAICSGSAAPSAHSKVRQTIG